MLRPLDPHGLHDYLHELRPRFITLQLRHGRTHLRWFTPTWALEEPLRYLLRMLDVLTALAPKQVERLTRNRLPARPVTHPWHAIDALFSERSRDLLATPTNEPLLEIDTTGTTIRIAQTRL